MAAMSPLNDLHGKVPPPPVHVVALGHGGPWEIQACAMTVKVAVCRDRNVADFIAALWNLMPAVEEPHEASPEEARQAGYQPTQYDPPREPRPYRRRKAGKSVQVMP